MIDFPAPELGFVRPLFGDVPVGAIMAFAGQLGPPDPPGPAQPSAAFGTTSPLEAWGWMACDGRMLETALYPELFVALGYRYGKGGKDGAEFALPNYGGYFLRGIGGGAKIDPDIGARSSPPGGDQAGVGSTQDFALQDHGHSYLVATAAGPGNQGSDPGVPSTATKETGGAVALEGSSVKVLVSPNETRPVNIYVNYIIKFTAGLRADPFHSPRKRRAGHAL